MQQANLYKVTLTSFHILKDDKMGKEKNPPNIASLFRVLQVFNVHMKWCCQPRFFVVKLSALNGSLHG